MQINSEYLFLNLKSIQLKKKKKKKELILILITLIVQFNPIYNFHEILLYRSWYQV